MAVPNYRYDTAQQQQRYEIPPYTVHLYYPIMANTATVICHTIPQLPLSSSISLLRIVNPAILPSLFASRQSAAELHLILPSSSMRSVHLLVLALLVCLLLSIPAVSAAGKKKGKTSDANRYHDCDSCVAAGYGWSWEEEECGSGYVNIDCRPPGSSPSSSEEHSSSNYESNIDTDDDSSALDDDDEYIPDDDDESLKTFSWQDTDATTHIWHIVNSGQYDQLAELLDRDADLVKYRSKDGRGALWWAYEYGHDDMVDLLLAAGADADATDANGKKPIDMKQHGEL